MVVLIILGVLLSVLVIWTVKQRGEERAREWAAHEVQPKGQLKLSGPIPERVCRALRQLGVDAYNLETYPADWSKQSHSFVINIAQSPISQVLIDYSPAMAVEGSFEEWGARCVLRGRGSVVTDFWGLFRSVEGTWTNPSRLKPVWNRLEEKARKLQETSAPPTETAAYYSVLQELGIGARVSRQHTIEIAQGPIRWVDVDQTDPYDDPDKYSIGWVVPDSRMEPDFPTIAIRSVRVKKIPLIGAVKEVRWEPYQSDPDFQDFEVAQRDLDFSTYVAVRLSQDKDVTDAIILYGKEIRISVDPEDGYWILGKEWWLSRSALADRAHHYECYRTVAKALLAMPMPTGE